MASPLQNITVAAPGFRGLNTQDSPLSLDTSFASIADNCVIDNYGRIGARKGRVLLTENQAILATVVTAPAWSLYTNGAWSRWKKKQWKLKLTIFQSSPVTV